MPGVLSVQPDENFGSDGKDYGGLSLLIPVMTLFMILMDRIYTALIVFPLGTML